MNASRSLIALLECARAELKRHPVLETGVVNIPWLITRGVHDLGLWEMVDAQVLEFVNDTIPQSVNDRKPVSRLMVMCFESYFGTRTSALLQDGSFRRKILDWFNRTGVGYFHAEPYLSKDPVSFVSSREQAYFGAEIKRVAGVNLVGNAHAASGLGEQLRSIARCFQANDIPYTIFNIPHRGDMCGLTAGLEPLSENQLCYAVSIYCLNIFETDRFWHAHGDQGFKDRYNIGLFPWELPAVPTEALHALTLVDEIWAISRFNAQAYKSAGHDNVIHMRPLVNTNIMAPIETSFARRPFRFLNVFDAQSYILRKNTVATVAAFQRAFPPEKADNVQLKIKVSNANWNDPMLQSIQSTCRADRRIELIDKTMSTEQLHKLFSQSDCYVSLHRSEGFGYTIAEAMLHEKPVIATDWSGSTDLMDESRGLPVRYELVDVEEGAYPFSAGQQWAEPDLDDAARNMLKVYGMPKEARGLLGQAAKQHVQQLHTGQSAQKAYIERISHIYSQL